MSAPPPVFTVDGNELTLLETGPFRLASLLALIDGAKHSLRLLYYIFANDKAGAKVRAALLRAAERGVTVHLILDGFGTGSFAPRDFFDPLGEAGVKICWFDPRLGRRYLLRNHQKIALADAETDDCRVIVGGFNVEEHYFTGKREVDAWRDLGILVVGPAARRLRHYYDDLTAWTSRPGATLKQMRALMRERHEPKGKVHWLLGGPTRRLSPWAKTVRDAIGKAAHVDIIAAYFAPSPGMLRRLDCAGRRTRHVRIISAAHSDSQTAIAAARFTFAGLLRKGVRIFEYQPSKLHTKLYVVDDAVFIGSANFDMRSLFINMEVMLRIEDTGFAEHMRHYVDREVRRCREITPEIYARTGLFQRARQFIAYAALGFLDPRISRGLNFGIEEGGAV